MPIKQPETDESVLNMTPMIDIVFNLVTFFMIAVDISHKDFVAVALPRAHAGVEDKDPATETDIAKRVTRFNIALTADGRIAFRNHEWKLEGTDVKPIDQWNALEGLKSALREVAGAPSDMRLREPDGSSKVVILIRGDRQALWKYVQWVMQVAADPQIKIYKMHFAVEAPPRDRPGGDK
jgi:biopolymer transport protein ExbD